MDIVYGEGRPDELEEIVAEDLRFRGPFFSFDSAKAYIDSLKKSPPEGFNYSLLKAYEDGSSACLVYEFTKPGVSTPMSQVFEVADGRIQKILLIFDTRPFKP